MGDPLPVEWAAQRTWTRIHDAMGRTEPPGADGATSAATILLAEDHGDSRDAMRALLEAFGYRVVPAANGREAVELARVTDPDLILMDIMMPELDGFEATRRLRGFPETRHIPIITLTAMDGARSRAKDAGADDFLPKPVSSGILLQMIRNWLNH